MDCVRTEKSKAVVWNTSSSSYYDGRPDKVTVCSVPVYVQHVRL